MQCREVEVVLEQDGLAPLPEAAKVHLAECATCQNLWADLTNIVATAHQFPAEADPPDRVWISLRAQLESEGIIKTQADVARSSAPWWQSFGDLFRNRAFAGAAVALLIVASAAYQLQKPAVAPPIVQQDALADTAIFLNQQEHDLSNMQLATTSPVDSSFRQNLQTVDDFIAECERRLKEEPQDDLAREYLSRAYQQKAELLSAMMDRGRSVN
jgi:hypothetical protein